MGVLINIAVTIVYLAVFLHFFYWQSRVMLRLWEIMQEEGIQIRGSYRKYWPKLDEDLRRKWRRAMILAVVCFVLFVIYTIISAPICLVLSLINDRPVCHELFG